MAGMPQQDGPRLEGRNGAVWAAYIGGATQERIAAKHGVSQQRISQILGEVRESVGDDARLDAALLARERTDALLAALWPEAMAGDTRAVTAALRVLERQARALGTDAPEPLAVSLERRTDVEGDVVADALGAALEVLDLDEGRQRLAVEAAQAKLAGAEPPTRPVPAVSEAPDLEADLDAFLREQGDDGGDDDAGR